MKFEVTLEQLEEYACCIVDNDLTRDEACDYIKSCVTGSDNFDPDEAKVDIFVDMNLGSNSLPSLKRNSGESND